MSDGKSTIRVFIEVEPHRSDWDWNRGQIQYAKVQRLLKKRPKVAAADTHLIVVDIDVPFTAFEHKVKVEL